jgi:hypothetical protein
MPGLRDFIAVKIVPDSGDLSRHFGSKEKTRSL